MKRFVYGIGTIVVVVLGLGFAYRNAAPVAVRYYGGLQWSAPLALILLTAFTIGVALGFLSAFMRLVGLRRQLLQTRKRIRQLEQEVANLRALPIKDVL
ncbi:MAG: LapA family protein [Gammaproteobacteria bacterium]|nr:LapA family protein [Gammaproteobacteria bacterium]